MSPHKCWNYFNYVFLIYIFYCVELLQLSFRVEAISTFCFHCCYSIFSHSFYSFNSKTCKVLKTCFFCVPYSIFNATAFFHYGHIGLSSKAHGKLIFSCSPKNQMSMGIYKSWKQSFSLSIYYFVLFFINFIKNAFISSIKNFTFMN